MRAPGRSTQTLVRAATLTLPAGTVRDRYRLELISELYEQPRSRRAALVLGLLVHVWSLRAAVMAAEPVGHVPHRFGCWTNLHHTWRVEHTDDGDRYRRCRLCGKDDDGLVSSADPAVQWTNVY